MIREGREQLFNESHYCPLEHFRYMPSSGATPTTRVDLEHADKEDVEQGNAADRTSRGG
jgi:hypothetical protein